MAAGPATGPRIGLVTLGCDKNTVDSEHMMAALVGQGARVASGVEDSEVPVVTDPVITLEFRVRVEDLPEPLREALSRVDESDLKLTAEIVLKTDA